MSGVSRRAVRHVERTPRLRVRALPAGRMVVLAASAGQARAVSWPGDYPTERRHRSIRPPGQYLGGLDDARPAGRSPQPASGDPAGGTGQDHRGVPDAFGREGHLPDGLGVSRWKRRILRLVGRVDHADAVDAELATLATQYIAETGNHPPKPSLRWIGDALIMDRSSKA